MTDRELMQQALEALEETRGGYSQNLIATLRERLAQPVQEPVAWGVFDGPNLHDVNFTEEEAHEMVRLKGDGSVVKPLYTPPAAQRQWVGLTDEDIFQMGLSNYIQVIREAEAKLKEKNA